MKKPVLLLSVFLTINILFLFSSCTCLPQQNGNATTTTTSIPQQFREAPKFYNSQDCPSIHKLDDNEFVCSNDGVHVAMTLDAAYIRGSMAAILSTLQHTSCPQNVFFHFVASASADASLLGSTIAASFPYLNFRIYRFHDSAVSGLISTSIRSALDCPLNYARSYLADLLPPCVRRVVYLDSDLVLVDDIAKLYAIQLGSDRVLAAPEYCNANFTSYFTPTFWSNPSLSLTFADRKACYFNTGVMVIDLDRWRGGGYTTKIEEWMELQKRMRIYELGSLPPFLLVFAGKIEPVDHRWNQVDETTFAAGEPAALEREGKAVGEARRQPTLPSRRALGSLRSAQASLFLRFKINGSRTEVGGGKVLGERKAEEKAEGFFFS